MTHCPKCCANPAPPKPPPDRSWMQMETIRDAPGAGVVYGLGLIGLLLIAALAFVIWNA